MTAIDEEVAAQLVSTIQDWVIREVLPCAAEYEKADRYPEHLVRQMKDFGLFGARIPAAYGGLGLEVRTYARIIEELAYGWMSLAGILNTHTIAANLIDRHGTDDQKQRLLPEMATGERRAAFSLSEPDAGSDTKAIRCKAVRDGDEYIVNGTKMWVTNGERAAIVALAARTDEGITCFIVEKEPGNTSGGISVSRHIEKLGYKGLETVEMSYVDHRIPTGSILGGTAGLGEGLHYILGSLELGRINVAARALGVAHAALDAAMNYAHERETFGVPIVGHQAIALQARRHGDEGRSLPFAGVLRRRQVRARRARRRRGRYGQAVRLRDGARGGDGSDANPRRIRLHDRLSRRAVLPGRATDDHRRGHQRDPADGDRPRPRRTVE